MPGVSLRDTGSPMDQSGGIYGNPLPDRRKAATFGLLRQAPDRVRPLAIVESVLESAASRRGVPETSGIVQVATTV